MDATARVRAGRPLAASFGIAEFALLRALDVAARVRLLAAAVDAHFARILACNAAAEFIVDWDVVAAVARVSRKIELNADIAPRWASKRTGQPGCNSFGRWIFFSRARWPTVAMRDPDALHK